MSAIGDTIGRIVPMARKKPKLDKRDILAIVPVRNSVITWERKGKDVILAIPMRNDWLARVVKTIVRRLPDCRQLQLDEVGSSVWEACDGERNIDAVVKLVMKDYKLARREAEASVTMFLQTLAKKNLIGLMSAGGKKGAKRKR